MQANEEQSLAIGLRGNTCLFAGAGAGKTFVIKEHVFSVVVEKVLEINQQYFENTDFEKKVRDYLSGVAVMTFTKKAAREIKLRVEGKFNETQIEGLSEERLEIVKNELSHLYVGTIHSFFYKILREYSLDVEAEEIEIKNEFEIQQQINDCLKSYLENNQEIENFVAFSKLHSRVANSIYSIVNQVDALEDWREALVPYSLTLEEVLHEFDLNLAKTKTNLAPHSAKASTGWYKLLTFINENIDSINDLNSLAAFLEGFSGFSKTKPRGKIATEMQEELIEITKLIEMAKESSDFISYYVKYPNDVLMWQRCYFDVLQRAVEDLEKNNLFGFSDIEKKLHLLLQNEPVRKNLQENLKYLIIDEYQDTSQVQFEIVSQMTGGDFTKLYVVGDPKQSIYSFRGGKIDVFFQTAEKLKNNPTMKNNYRSAREVIEFNNTLFEALLNELGGDYPDLKLDVSQVHGNESIIGGKVASLALTEQCQPEDVKKFPSAACEESLLLQRIEQISNEHPNEKIAVLVRKTKHALGLAKKLIREGKGVHFQFKLFGDDSPIIMLFKDLIEIALCESQEYPNILARVQQDLRGVHLNDLVLDKEFKNCWEKDIQLYGVLEAFKLFLTRNGVSTIQISEQMDYLEILLACYGSSLDLVWEVLNRSSEIQTPIEVNTHSNPTFYFMTVHASKGLEFDHVILGGLYQSQRSKNDTSLMGMRPDEFSVPHVETGETIQTFHRIRAKKERKRQEVEESLRLFYVACTRAVKTLSFVNLKGIEPGSGSWAKEMNQLFGQVESKLAHINFEYHAESEEQSTGSESISLFERERKKANCIVFPEVSVSKLSDLVVCPKYFYLKNVLKLTPEFQSYASEKAVSSADRGTEVHALLEGYVNQIAAGTEKDFDLHWAEQKIDELRLSYQLQAEHDVKFKVMGQMISGTIDLVGENKESLVIVDYKTGKFNPLQNSKYLFQVILYAKSLLVNKTSIKQITLDIWYVDLKKSMTYTLLPDDVDQAIQFYWSKMSDYSVQNKAHCRECFLSNICL